jgi:hypothetical protein
MFKSGKDEAIPVAGRVEPEDCESWLTTFLGSRLTDGREVISRTCRPSFTLRKIPCTHFCRSQGRSAAARIRLIEKSNDIRNRNDELPACSLVPLSTTPLRAPCSDQCRLKSTS